MPPQSGLYQTLTGRGVENANQPDQECKRKGRRRLAYVELLIACTFLVWLISTFLLSCKVGDRPNIPSLPIRHIPFSIFRSRLQVESPNKNQRLQHLAMHEPPNQTLARIEAIFDGSALLHLSLDASDALCPTPRMALIGVHVNHEKALDPDASARRTYLRHIYNNINSNIPFEENVKVVFIFNTPSDAITNPLHMGLHVETEMHPFDTAVLYKSADESGIKRRFNALNDKKVDEMLSWFSYARKELYEPHPTIPDKWCKRYSFVGQAADETVIHIERLASVLKDTLRNSTTATHNVKNPPPKSVVVGRMFTDVLRGFRGTQIVETGFHDLLVLVSADLVEWLQFSPIPTKSVHRLSKEKLLARWLDLSNLAVRKLKMGASQFHHIPHKSTAQKDSYQTLSKDKTARAPNPLEGPVTEDSIVLSGCSDLTTFFKCVSSLYETSHQVIRMGHRLMDEQSLKYRARKIGLDGILNESDTKSISKSIKSTLRAKAQMKIAQIDRELYNMALSKILEELLGSNEVSIGHLPLEIFQETAIKSLHSFGVIPWTADEGDTPTENEAEAYRFRKAAAESFMKVRATTYGIFVPKQYSEILGAQIVKLLKVRHHTGLLPNEFDILLLGFVEEWKLWDDSMAEELKRKKKQLENGEKDGHWHRMKWAPKDSDFVRQIVSVRARQVKILLDKTQVRMVVKRLFREDHIATILSNDRALALIIIETVIRDRVTSMNVKKSIEETAFRQVANQLIDSKDLDILLQDFDSLLQHLDLTKRK